MNITQQLVGKILGCPFCAGDIEVKQVQRQASDGGIQYGLLRCKDCEFDYPVVDGIAILMAPHESVDSKFETTAITRVEGPRVLDVTAALQAGEPILALSLLFNPSTLEGQWFPRLPKGVARNGFFRNGVESRQGRTGRLGRALGKVQMRGKRAVAKYVLPHARMRLSDFLKASEETLSAIDVMQLYYRQFSGAETFNYFAYRFGQPRHLAALSLASLLDGTTDPILDLACGAGHLTHYLSLARRGRTVIGVDRDFVRLWIASRFVAPDATYICASADQPLPLRDGVFGGAICSDAFHYFLRRAAAIAEMRRTLSQDGILLIARVGNARAEPREGYELSLDGYGRLLGDVARVFLGEADLVRAYTERKTPDLGPSMRSDLATEKWLSIVSSRRMDAIAGAKTFVKWPHAAGRLQINPLYVVERRGESGDSVLRFEFPSDWYRFENAAYLTYAPERTVLPARIVRALELGDDNAEMDQYIRQFVVIGMPERYGRPARA